MTFRTARASVLRALTTLGVAALLLNGCAVDAEGEGDQSFEEADDRQAAGGVCDDVCLHAEAPADMDVDACFDSCEASLEDDAYRSGLDSAISACANNWRCLCRVVGCEGYY